MSRLQQDARTIEITTLKNSTNRSQSKKQIEISVMHQEIKRKENTNRKIYLNDSYKTKQKYNYPNNMVITSKYTWYNFFPKSLLLQFRRYANLYFLMITILQCFPIISPLNPITAIGPFSLVLLISIIREGMEDLQKHKQDHKENKEKVMKYNAYKNGYESDLSYNLEVGDVLKISEFDVVPADCVLLSCANTTKIAFIETANLDGEKNLKPKYCIPSLFEIFRNAQNILRIRGTMIINKPKADLNAIEGQYRIRNNLTEKINPTHFLYKGTVLKNTKWAIAVVVYTGVQTKIIMNSERAPPKQSHLEVLVNKLIGLIFLFQMTLCIVLAVLNSVWFYKYSVTTKYLEFSLSTVLTSYKISGMITFFSYLLLLNTMIPISLIVTLELVKYAQAYFINVDTDLFSRLRKSFAHCNSCSLNEELGQIKYIFSDKTGTLTMNKFEFKACAIGDNIYGIPKEKLTGIERGNMSALKRTPTFKIKEITMKVNFSLEAFKDLTDITLRKFSGKTFHNIKISSKNGKNFIKIENMKDLVDHYMSCLALNHTCFTEYKLKEGREEIKRHTARPSKIAVDGMVRNTSNFSIASNMSQNIDQNFDNYELSMKGNNPDEIVIVDAARHLGYIFTGGDQATYKLKISKENYDRTLIYDDRRVEIIKVLEFNSGRGMMSVVVREMNTNDNKIILYAKGGDTKIIERCKTQDNQPFYHQVRENANKLAEIGLRVLLIGMKIIEKDEWDAWKKDFETGLKAYENVDNLNENKIKYINTKYEEIEKGLTLIGCTALEDKLQDQVPQTIKELQTAGINVWVLTGDNLPTAKNIALMCNLIPKGMHVYELNNSIDKFKEKVAETLKTSIASIFNDAEIEKSKKIIEGFEQSVIQDDKKMKDYYPVQMIETKSILYAGLSSLLIQYTDLEKNDKAVMRGVLVESDILKNVLPPDELHSLKYYGHPLTKIFLELTLNSQTVVCCRVAPKQKALVVSMVKKNIKGAITLAVGDGANDVTMIGVADVGVGLYGEEGTQAARESDYAIGEFKCLRRLILFHGRLNYLRIAEMILYFFFKNFLFTIPQFYWAFYCAYSAQTIYDDWFVSLYNVIFTSLPLLFKAILEQDINDDDGEFVKSMIPYTYYQGREGIIFNIPNFFYTIIVAICESVVIYFFISYMMIYSIPQNYDGFIADFWSVSLTQFSVIILIVNFRLLVTQRYHTFMNFIIIFITSYGSYIGYFFVSAEFAYSKSEATRNVLLSFPQFYLCLFLISGMTLLYDLGIYFIKINYYDEPVTLLRRYLVESKNQKDTIDLEETTQKKILDYDEKVRNLYKVERVKIE